MKKTLIFSLFILFFALAVLVRPAAASSSDDCTVTYVKGLPVTPTKVCSETSKFTLVLRNFSGQLLTGMKFELYEQEKDANGLPIAGTRLTSGTIDETGKAEFSFKPDICQAYVLKVWDKRADLGEFWFFDATRFVCGYDRTLIKYLPALKIIVRDASGNLKSNYKFSLYAQRYDADGNPSYATSDLIASLSTGSTGQATAYVAGYNPYRAQTGSYAISAKDSGNHTAVAYDIIVPNESDYTFEYRFSGISGTLRDASGKLLSGKEVRLYEQAAGATALGKELMKVKTGTDGRFQLEYPAGTYALAVRDDLGKENAFWNIAVKSGASEAKLSTGLVNFSLTDSLGEGAATNASLKLYSLTSDGSGRYYRDKQVGTVKLSSRAATMSLSAGPYVAVYAGKNGREYGQAFYAKNGSVRTAKLVISTKSLLSDNQQFTISGSTVSAVSSSSSSSSTSSSSSATGSSLSSSLKGRIVLQAQSAGQAWYINPADGKKYYLGRPTDAFSVMRRLGLGISNSDFAALEKNTYSFRRLAGRILIKTEDNGRAYYFEPVNLKLYYLGRPSDAFDVMRGLGLGITDSDLNKIVSGS